MNSLLKNFMHVFKRFRTAGILNILGLTAAFAGFLLLLVQISYEVNFDKSYPNWENIYRFRIQRADLEEKNKVLSTLFIRNIADVVIENSPQIEKATLLYPYNENVYVQVDKGQTRQGFRESLFTCYSDLPDVFGFQMTEGTRSCLEDPQNALIPESMAKRLFGSESAVGKILYFTDNVQTKTVRGSAPVDLVVGGVYKDFPENVQLENVIYSAMHKDTYKHKGDGSSNFLFYARLTEGADLSQLENIFMNNRDLYDFGVNIGDGIEVRLMIDNISDIYFSEGEGRYANFGYKTGDKNTSTLLIIIAILVVAVAAVNFTNFSTAMAPRRIRSINIRKVLGSSNTELRIGIVSEAVILSVLAFALSLGLVYLIIRYNWMPFIDTGISTDSFLHVFLLSFLVALLTGCVAGIRPAFYMTSFAPSEAIKGTVVSTSSGFKVRSLLVGFQFVIAIALISATVLIFAQFLYMKNYNLGFDTDQVAIVGLNAEMANNRKAEYTDKLKAHPAIVDVAFSERKLGAYDQYTEYGSMRLNGGEENVSYMLFPVSWNFLSVMGIEPIEGRRFTEEDANSGETSLIINKTTQKNTGAEVGDSFTYSWKMNIPQRVVGIVDDIQFSSLRRQMGNTAFTLNDKNGHDFLPVSYIRIAAGANITDAVEHINKTVASIDTAYPVKVEFYDEIFDQLYQRETKLSNSIYTFSLLAIIIAMMGVFGMVVFDCEARRKEIALRKVMGSNISQVLALFNVQYIRVLCVSLLIAVPIVYYMIAKWLQSFAYKTPIHWWMLLVGGVIILIITVLTVTAQSYRTATANPIEALKNE